MKKKHSKYDYQSRQLLFLDILGMREMVEQKTLSPEKILKILSAATQLKDKYLKPNVSGLPFEINDIQDRQVSAFSDTVIISYPHGDYLSGIALLSEAIALQNIFLSKGIATRGAIVSGALYHKDDIIFGSTLIRAYDIERFVSVYPRVVIDKSWLEDIQKFSQTFASETAPQMESQLKEKLGEHIKPTPISIEKQLHEQLLTQFRNLLYKDRDGLYFVDFLHYHPANELADKQNESISNLSKKIIAEQLTKTNTNLSIIQKWSWLSHYAKHPKATYFPESHLKNEYETIQTCEVVLNVQPK